MKKPEKPKIGKGNRDAWMIMLNDEGQPYFWNMKLHPHLTNTMERIWKNLIKRGVVS